ncbi:MAG: AarF/ABC1/UbiB kinase family protein [Actinobacteria bacterium]|nr:AarF/ABC1/UbiB kinase family protein [Actinomycetota bacterium]
MPSDPLLLLAQTTSTSDDEVLFTLDGFIPMVLILWIIGWLTGRLLGVRRGFWRALIAGLIGYGAGWAYLYVQYGDVDQLDSGEEILALGAGFFGYILLVTMIASVVMEAILRPRTKGRRLRIPHPFAWIGMKFALVQRLFQILAAARHNGLAGRKFVSKAALSSPEGARALRKTLEECGGMFIKFGQIAASRDDFLPETITHELAKLRTAVKPLPFAQVQAVLAAELGPGYMEHFEWISEEPLAAASIGVTHEARLVDGTRVIVKVRRPKIQQIVDRDSRVLLWGARQLERGSESARQLGIVDLAEELVSGVKEELDFTREAANNEAMIRNHTDDAGVAYPKVIDALTSRKVLVMDEVRGQPVSDDAAVEAAGIPRNELADRLLKAFLDQVLHDGVYHADPHPGNILIDAAGTMWFIDYGAVGYLDPITLEALQQMAIGFTLRDPGLLARATRRMAGSQGEDLDIPSLEFDMGQVVTQIEGSGFGPAAIGQVIHVLQRHSVKVPRSLTVLGRAAVTMEGTLRELSPGYSMSHAAVRLVEAQPKMEGAQDALTKEMLRALPSLRPLPEITEDLALQARSGRLSLRVSLFNGEDQMAVDRWVDRVIWATLAVAGLVGSALLLIASAMFESSQPSVSLYTRVIGFIGLIVSTAMQMRTIARVLRRGNADDARRDHV